MTFKNFTYRFTLHFLQFLPDKVYLRLLYWSYTGRKLNLRKPKRFTEKIQWLKLFDRNPIYTQMADKNAVKHLMAEKIGEKYIIPTLAVVDHWDDIDFDRLPNQFVIKTTHGGGSSGVVVVRDKTTLVTTNAKAKTERSLTKNGYDSYREYQYKDIPRKILVEEYIAPQTGEDLTDYKFYCFNGEPKFCQVIRDRNTQETIDFYDMNWEHQPFIGINPNAIYGSSPVPRPGKLDEMIAICRKISKGIPFLRVDLYYINDKIYFGETTFHPASGLGFFSPDEYDFELGKLIIVD